MVRNRSTWRTMALSIVLCALCMAQAMHGQSPAYKLHVLSALNLGLRVQTDSTGGSVASFGGNGDFQIDAPGVVGGRLAVKEDGRVGVGTNAPLAKFDLVAGADADGTNDLRAIAFQWRAAGYRHWIRTRHSATLGSNNAIDFFVNHSSGPDGSSGPGTGSVHVMTLDSSRVGIGTTNPTEMLTVVGTVQSTSGGFKFPDGSVQTSSAPSPNNDAVYTRSGFLNQQLLASAATIVHLDLPDGLYTVTATVSFRNTASFFAQDNGRYFDCRFAPEQMVAYSNYLGSLETITSTFHTVLQISGGGIDFNCHVTTASEPTSVFARSSRMTAVKINGTVAIQ